jgi:hypothetical protein
MHSVSLSCQQGFETHNQTSRCSVYFVALSRGVRHVILCRCISAPSPVRICARSNGIWIVVIYTDDCIQRMSPVTRFGWLLSLAWEKKVPLFLQDASLPKGKRLCVASLLEEVEQVLSASFHTGYDGFMARHSG